MVFIYILQLVNGKYYIGKTNNPSFRLDQHFNSEGSKWTKKYKPISVLEIISNCDDYDEDKYTIKFMEQYGINNVRGGSFCEIKLSDTNISTLNQMMKGVTDKCYICGKNDHFVNNCKNFVVKKDETYVANEKCNCPTSFMFPHRRKKCSLNKLILLFDDENDNIDKIIKHKETQDTEQVKIEKNNGSCFRCGRHGHYISSCYASTHIKGYSIK
jgi:hypothetical protein